MLPQVVIALFYLISTPFASAIPGVFVPGDNADVRVQMEDTGSASKAEFTEIEGGVGIHPRGVLAAPVTRPQTFGPAHTTIFRAPVAAFTPTNLILTPTLPRPKYTVLATAPGIEGKPFGEEPSFDAPELSVDLSPSTDGDGSASKTGLIIAVSIISVFLVITTSICVYLAKKIRDQRIYYEAQLAAARAGSSAAAYEPQYIEGGDDVPLVAHEKKDAQARSSQSSV